MNKNNVNLDMLNAWQYELPSDLIASRPTARRDESRLMVVDRSSGTIRHQMIRDLPDLLHPNDLLVFNNTRVLPARLFGFRTSTGGKWEGLFVREVKPGEWIILGETRGKLQPDETITVVPAYDDSSNQPGDTRISLTLRLKEKQDDGSWLVQVPSYSSLMDLLEAFGSLPLPPYMGRKLADEEDQQRYQTQFATQPGAVAAPTAGLHFTPELLQRCSATGINRTEITLHVGIGTFRPVSVDNLDHHDMHYEWCCVPEDAANSIVNTRAGGGNVVAVGTTSVRTLESTPMQTGGPMQSWQGETNLFIRPGFSFTAVDRLLTNFHLPGSTLIVLVAAFMGYDLTMEAYRHAVEQRYRFYSYGDAMLIL